MKPQTLRTFIDVHTWVGIVAGFALFIAFYAGSLTVFSHELHEWDATAERGRAHDSVADADALIAAALEQQPAARERFFLQLPGDHGPRTTLRWFEPQPGGKFETHEFRWSNGQLDSAPDQSQLAHLIDELHYTAGIPGPWGLYAFGFICILYGVALVTGVIMYAPNFLGDLFALRVGKNLKRLWQDAHNVIGMLSLPFHAVFAWSGAVLCIGFLLLAPFQFLAFGGKLMPIIEPDLDVVRPAAATGVPAPMLPIAQLLDRAHAALPTLEPESLTFTHAGDEHAQVTIYGHAGDEALTNASGVALDANSGEVLRVVEPKTFSAGTTFLRGLTSLHFGSYGHAAVQWLYFILGMAGAFLFYSGNLLWIETRRNRRAPNQTRGSVVMAKLTLGICLGCIAGISAAFVATRAFPADSLQRAAGVETAYFGVFFAALAWALMRAPARAANELLLACAALTAAIPIVDVVVTGTPPWSGGSISIGVQVTSVMFAWGYWRLARVIRERGRDGDPNSVWSLPAHRNGRGARGHTELGENG